MIEDMIEVYPHDISEIPSEMEEENYEKCILFSQQAQHPLHKDELIDLILIFIEALNRDEERMSKDWDEFQLRKAMIQYIPRDAIIEDEFFSLLPSLMKDFFTYLDRNDLAHAIDKYTDIMNERMFEPEFWSDDKQLIVEITMKDETEWDHGIDETDLELLDEMSYS